MRKKLAIIGLMLMLLTITFSGCVENHPQDVPGGHEEKEQILHSNLKDMTKYEDKMVFLISDENWRDVLSLIPLSIWTNSNLTVKEYPLLIYHYETNEQMPVDITYLANSTYEIWDYYHGQVIDGNITEISVSNNLVEYGESFTLTLKIKNYEQQTIDLSSIPIDGFHVIYNGWIQEYPFQFFNGIFNFTGMEIENGVEIWAPGEEINIILNYRQNNVPSFDADSIINFMQQYSGKKVITVGNIPEELSNILLNLDSSPEIVTLDSSDIISYWNLTKNIVLVDYDDYDTGLLASTFASYCNAPLLFVNSNNLNEYKELINEKQVFMIGDLDSPIVNYVNSNAKNFTTYTLQELRELYVGLTETDKILIVNPDDVEKEKAITEKFTPEKTSNPIFSLYYKTSLAAPILAAAKHELIITVPSNDCVSVNQYLKNQIINLEMNPRYLTIIANPNEIQMSQDVPQEMLEAWGIEEVDNHLYGNLDDDFFQELAVGRIFGITISDISSYLARDLFYNELPQSDEFAVISSNTCGMFLISELIHAAGYLGYSDVSDITNATSINLSVLEDKCVIAYEGHGYSGGLMRGINSIELMSQKIWFNSPIFFAKACSTCDFNEQNLKKDFFCANILRRGALAYIGAVTPESSEISFKAFLEDLLGVRQDIGQIMRLTKNKAAVFEMSQSRRYAQNLLDIGLDTELEGKKLKDYDAYYILLGDPTLEIPFSSPEISEDKKIKVTFNASSEIITLSIPSVKKDCSYEVDYGDFSYYSKVINYVFNVPYGSEIYGFFRVQSDFYNGSELVESFGNDEAYYVFFINLTSDKEIKSITKVEYVKNNECFVISEIPIFASTANYSNADDFIFYYKDDEISNKYWFNFWEVLGGNPPLVLTEDELPAYEYRIYLELS